MGDFVNELRSMKVTPHVTQNTTNRRSAIDGRTTRHPGYAVSQRIRKRIEEAFGWIKTVAGQDKTKFRGVDRARMRPSPSLPPPTISSDCPSCLRSSGDGQGSRIRQGLRRSPADRRDGYPGMKPAAPSSTQPTSSTAC